ncbi:MAG: hypothetical protein O7A09_14385 [Proteobacteria bacterium]|nr:hypothetical protein [Pseudomonadota bacterium]
MSPLLPILVAALLALPSLASADHITRILDASGTQHFLDGARGVAVDAGGTVYVTGFNNATAFAIDPTGTIAALIDATGDGQGNELRRPRSVGVDDAGNVYVNGGTGNDSVFRIEPSGAITRILDPSGAGAGDPLPAAG